MKIEIEHLSETRVIVHVNGFALDVLADQDGITAQLFKGEVLQTELAQDWDEKHINEEA